MPIVSFIQFMKRLSNSESDQHLIELVRASKVYRDLANAFGKATSIILTLVPNDGRAMMLVKPYKNGCEDSGSGIQATLVPIRLAGRLIGFIHTGPFNLYAPGSICFDDPLRTIECLGQDSEEIGVLKRAYTQEMAIGSGRYQTMVDLVTVMSRYVSSTLDRVTITRSGGIDPVRQLAA